jgi:hypothetical protein
MNALMMVVVLFLRFTAVARRRWEPRRHHEMRRAKQAMNQYANPGFGRRETRSPHAPEGTSAADRRADLA